MLNYWWVTRPKRKLNSIPDVLAAFTNATLNQEWDGDRDTHLSLESALESAGLKRVGERRDQTGGGARTYKAWLISLGLIFIQESTGKVRLTLAGEALLNGESPVKVLKNQVIKYQFPSSFSVGRGIDLSPRFKIRPFKFLLRLLSDNNIGYLTQEEIAKIIIVEAENETDRCYNHVVARLLEFRDRGDCCLEQDFFTKYKPSKGEVSLNRAYGYLLDIANTIINWLEYTQLIYREDGKIAVLEAKKDEVHTIVEDNSPFIDRPNEHEFFQRKYGLDPKHKKDTRNLTQTQTVTARVIVDRTIQQAFLAESFITPITRITAELIDKICERTGVEARVVEDTLLRNYPHGAVSSFMTQYFEMAFKGRDEATEFEKATVELFREVFGFETQHIGPIGLTPDVLLISDNDRYVGIIDNKAYAKYSISNDHHNRMVHNYIPAYSNNRYPLAFFSYIAGGFGSHIDTQLQSIVSTTNIHGSAIDVSRVIALIEKHAQQPYTHTAIKELFSIDRQIIMSDL